MINFRTMKEEDIDQVDLLEHSSFSQPWPRHALLEIVTKKDAEYYVAEDADTGKIMGGCAMFFIVGEGDITNVAVFPEYQNKGVGTSLIRYAVSEGRKQGLTEFTLEVRVGNKAAIRAYEKVGFVGEGIRPKFYEAPVEDALIMWLRE